MLFILRQVVLLLSRLVVSATPSSMAPAVWLLGLTQIIGYGSLQYGFGGLASSMAADFGWSDEWVFGTLSLSLLAGGLAAPLSGAWADRYGAARVMVFGSIGAAGALALTALAPDGISFIVGLAAVAVASAFVLYATAFAALAQIAGIRAQVSITHLTLIAGLASTIFWPLTAMLQEHLSWRVVYLIFAGLNLVVAAPAHLWLSLHTAARKAATPSHDVAPVMLVSNEPAVASLLLAGFAILGFISSAILMHMVPLLAALGLAASGAFVAALFGPAQVLSRLLNMQFGKGLSQPALATLASLLMPLGVVALVASAPSVSGAMLFAVLFGLGSGITSIVSGTLPLVLFGSKGYGKRLGWMSLARQLASAVAPVTFSVIAAATSPPTALWIVGLGAFAGTACFATIWALCSYPSARIA